MFKYIFHLCLMVHASLAAATLPIGKETLTIITPDEQKWKDVSADGRSITSSVLWGKPEQGGLYVILAKLPAGFKSDAHFFARAVNGYVVSGTLHLFFLGAAKDSQHQILEKGTFINIPPFAEYYGWVEEETEVQMFGDGPFREIFPAHKQSS